MGSIQSWIIPKTLKMVLDTSLLNTQQYKVRIKWSNPGKGVVPAPTPQCSSYWKGSLLVTLEYSRQLYFITYEGLLNIQLFLHLLLLKFYLLINNCKLAHIFLHYYWNHIIDIIILIINDKIYHNYFTDWYIIIKMLKTTFCIIILIILLISLL